MKALGRMQAARRDLDATGSCRVVKTQSSPRRTLRIQFTCNRCSSVNITSVNPRAWASGTIFIEVRTKSYARIALMIQVDISCPCWPAMQC